MYKKDFIEMVDNLNEKLPLDITPIPYFYQGSTFCMDNIRLTGSEKFIISVLSRIKDIVDFENEETRLCPIYAETKDKITRELTGSYNCYLQVRERGTEEDYIKLQGKIGNFEVVGDNEDGTFVVKPKSKEEE